MRRQSYASNLNNQKMFKLVKKKTSLFPKKQRFSINSIELKKRYRKRKSIIYNNYLFNAQIYLNKILYNKYGKNSENNYNINKINYLFKKNKTSLLKLYYEEMLIEIDNNEFLKKYYKSHNLRKKFKDLIIVKSKILKPYPIYSNLDDFSKEIILQNLNNKQILINHQFENKQIYYENKIIFKKFNYILDDYNLNDDSSIFSENENILKKASHQQNENDNKKDSFISIENLIKTIDLNEKKNSKEEDYSDKIINKKSIFDIFSENKLNNIKQTKRGSFAGMFVFKEEDQKKINKYIEDKKEENELKHKKKKKILNIKNLINNSNYKFRNFSSVKNFKEKFLKKKIEKNFFIKTFCDFEKNMSNNLSSFCLNNTEQKIIKNNNYDNYNIFPKLYPNNIKNLSNSRFLFDNKLKYFKLKKRQKNELSSKNNIDSFNNTIRTYKNSPINYYNNSIKTDKFNKTNVTQKNTLKISNTFLNKILNEKNNNKQIKLIFKKIN